MSPPNDKPPERPAERAQDRKPDGPLAGLRVLLIEDMASLRMVYRSILIHAGAEVRVAGTAAEGRAQFRERPVPVVLLDLALPDGDGLDLLRDLRAMRADVRVVVITAHGGVGRAVQAMRAGAQDFLVKPFDEDRLIAATRSAAQSLAAPGRRPRAIAEGLGAMIGSSRAMSGVAILIASAAPAMAPVLVTGQPGAGKELCARMLHALSGRAEGQFLRIDAQATGPEALEAALFGDATVLPQGTEATLYLANLPVVPLNLQRRLIPLLQSGAVQGEDGARRRGLGQVRLVAGCSIAPEAALSLGQLDPMLFRLLDTLRIDLPPLKDRGRDVLEIARAALAHFGAETGKTFDGFSTSVEELFGNLAWPGNVRELLNLVRQVVLVQPGGLVTLDMLPDRIVPSPLRGVDRSGLALGGAQAGQIAPPPVTTGGPVQVAPGARDRALAALHGLTLAEVERLVIEQAIAAEGGSLPRAAKVLGLAPSTLYRKRQGWMGGAGDMPETPATDPPPDPG